MNIYILIFSLWSTVMPVSGSYPDEHIRSYMLEKVNAIRSSGCKCGRKYMPPAGVVKWNDKLFISAENHAKEMAQFRFFAHFSKDGLDIGDRLEKFGYNWQVAGENLGEGQKNFDEVLKDWVASYSHCQMLMNPKVTEMAVAKVDKYWVQHFGKQMGE